MVFVYEMKYFINDNTIEIEYIANGKRKKMQLKNDDKTDMDFFNQLMSAKSSKRDAMCDLYKREILKKTDPNSVSIQPLKLSSELKKSSVAEKQELNQRKKELEQDRENTIREAKLLVKVKSRHKDINSLTYEDLIDDEDEDRLKAIQARYNEIDRVYKLVVNQVENLDINNVTSVRINEIKELNVETFKKLEEYVGKFDLSNSSKEELMKEFKQILGFQDLKDNTIIPVSYLISAIPEMNTNAAIKVREALEMNQINPNQSIEFGVLKDYIGKDIFKSIEIPLKNALLLSLKDSNDFAENFQRFFDLDTNIKKYVDENWNEFIESLINNFKEPSTEFTSMKSQIQWFAALDQLKMLLRNLDYIKKEGEFAINKPIMINFKSYTLLIYRNNSDWRENYLGELLSKLTDDKRNQSQKLIYTQTITIDNRRASQKYNIYIKIISSEYMLSSEGKKTLLDKFINLLSIQYTKYKSIKPYNIQFYFNYYPIAEITTQIKSDIMKLGDIFNFLKVKDEVISADKEIKRSQTQSQTPSKQQKVTPINLSNTRLDEFSSDFSDSDLFDLEIDDTELLLDSPKPKQTPTQPKELSKGLDEDLSGKIMIDLNKSDVEDKLNEIIRLLSQMNYNVFTTTPMYSKVKNKGSKNMRSNQRGQEYTKNNSRDKTSQGIDLYDILNL